MILWFRLVLEVIVFWWCIRYFITLWFKIILEVIMYNVLYELMV